MSDIFISYAQSDNVAYSQVTNEFTNVVDHLLNLHALLRQRAGKPKLDIFFDTRLRAGDSIPESIRREIQDCSVMMAFYSPTYFQSRYCRDEYEEFKRTQRGRSDLGQPDKWLIPVEVHSVDIEQLPNKDERGLRDWVAELAGGQGRKRLVSGEDLRDLDTAALMAALRKLEDGLDEFLADRRGASQDQRRRTNVFTLEAKLPSESMRDQVVEEELKLFEVVRKFPRVSPVLVIYTGGTVGMVQESEDPVVHGNVDFKIASSVLEMVEHIRPRLSPLPFDVVLAGMAEPIDSSNVTSADWTLLARLLAEQMDRYQGFVILHGTNTLAYTASALSFLLEDVITKPVILTGAEVPLSVENTDAINNIENAIRAAGWQANHGPMPVPEVCVYWNTQLFRGNRTTKMHASDRASNFHTPNMPTPLATLENERLRVNAEQVWHIDAPLKRQGARIVDLSNVRIDILFVHPQMNLEVLKAAYRDGLDGLILLSYGPGNVPDDTEFTSFIGGLIEQGVTVCNVTQCPYGRVELKLFETNAVLFDMGVIDGYDLTTEAAYGKLLWAIAKNAPFDVTLQDVKRDFQRCVAGEMSATIEDVSFGASHEFAHRDGYLLSRPQPLQAGSKYAVIDAFLRIEGIRVDPDRASAGVRVFMEDRDPTTATEESMIAEFERTYTAADRRRGTFSKNLQVTHGFRKWYPGGKAQLLLTTTNGGPLQFNSMRLVVYSWPRRP